MIRHLFAFASFTLFLISGNSSRAQIGLKIAQSSPIGDFGNAFSKAPTFEFIYYHKMYEGKLLSKVSFSYTKFKPREDTIPIYLVKFDNGYKVYPGKLSFSELPYYGLSIDNQFRLFQKNNFELYAGLGLAFTRVKFQYYRSYETILTENSYTADYAAGANISLLANYNINEYLSIFADVQYQYSTLTDWSYQFHNRKIGIGFMYTFNPDEED